MLHDIVCCQNAGARKKIVPPTVMLQCDLRVKHYKGGGGGGGRGVKMDDTASRVYLASAQ